MSKMERVDDFLIVARLMPIGTLGIKGRVPSPRNMQIIRSYWVQSGVWDGVVAIKLTSPLGDLPDALIATGAGVAGDTYTVDHRPENNNSFQEGTPINLDVIDASVAGAVSVTLVCRPI